MAAAVPPTVKVYYGKPMLPDVSRVLACLYEKEIKFDLVDMYKGQSMPVDILKLQATMKAPVPVFEDTEKLLLDSRTICRYVSEKYADHGNRYLLGRDLLERGSIEQWLKTEEQSFNPPSWALVFHLAFSPLTNVNEPDLAESKKMLGKVLDVYEHRLRVSKYLAGDEFTLADLSHLPNTHHLANSEVRGYLFDSRENVHRWWDTISKRPSWAKVVEILSKEEPLKKTSAAKDVSSTAQTTAPPPKPNSQREPSTQEASQSKQGDSSISQPTSPAPTQSSQVEQGDSSTDQPRSESSPKTDAPSGQLNSPKNSETQKKKEVDSAGSNTASDKPKSQLSSDSSISHPTSPAPTQSSQVERGDSSTDQPRSGPPQASPKIDAPTGQWNPPKNSETQNTKEVDSAGSNTALDKPKAQLSSDSSISQPTSPAPTQSSQVEQGDSSTDQPRSAPPQSSPKTDAPTGQFNPPKNSETQNMKEVDSAGSNTASAKPKSQLSSDANPPS